MTYTQGLINDINRYEKEVDSARLIFNDKNKLLQNAIQKYQLACKHENTKEVHINEEGGYDYKAEYHTDTYCCDCNLLLGRTTKYGGFG